MKTKYDLYVKFKVATGWMAKSFLEPGVLTQRDWTDYVSLMNQCDIAFSGMNENEIKEFEKIANFM